MPRVKNSPAFGVVILGAGASSRMGRPKLLLPWRDTTVIGAILQQWRELGAGQIAVVHRPNDTALLAELDRLDHSRAGRVENLRPELGMFSSIVCAANWSGWKKGISNWAIVLGDQPHLQTATLGALLAFAAQNTGAISQPQFVGHGRHPVILPRTAFEALKRTRAGNLRDFLKQASCPSVKCPMADPGLAFDLDTPEDYRQLQGST